MSNYEDIMVSNKTTTGMTLTSDDRQFLKRMMDSQDTILEGYMKEHFNYLRKYIDDHLEKMLNLIYDQNRLILNIQRVLTTIQSEIVEHEGRLNILETKVDEHLKENRKK